MSIVEESSKVSSAHLMACFQAIPKLLGSLIVVNGVNLVDAQTYNIIQYVNNAYLFDITKNNEIEVPVDA